MFGKLAKRTAYLAVLGCAATFALGGLAGWSINERVHREREAQRYVSTRMGGYRFINPLLECESAQDAIQNEIFRSFEARLTSIIDRWKQRSSVEHVSVYFREMNNGLNFGINDQEKFSPASLIKIPLMMAYFKASEQDPLLLGRRLTFTGESDETVNQWFKPAVQLQPGRSYTVKELIRAAIVYSDNNAYYLLFANLSPKVQRAVFLDLGLQVPQVRTMEDYVTVNEYAAFFRILFNASYLSHEHSEQALEILSEAAFPGGLRAGVPQNVPVAHKFGEWALGGDDDIKQLHDCGIVYYPGQPYLLCVMSRGLSYDDLNGVIGEISRATFDEVNRRYRAF